MQRLLKLELPEHDDLILVGSNMGGYFSTTAAATLKPKGIFLLAPAIGLPGYAGYPEVPGSTRVSIVHGWQDEVILVENVTDWSD